MNQSILLRCLWIEVSKGLACTSVTFDQDLQQALGVVFTKLHFLRKQTSYRVLVGFSSLIKCLCERPGAYPKIDQLKGALLV